MRFHKCIKFPQTQTELDFMYDVLFGQGYVWYFDMDLYELCHYSSTDDKYGMNDIIQWTTENNIPTIIDNDNDDWVEYICSANEQYRVPIHLFNNRVINGYMHVYQDDYGKINIYPFDRKDDAEVVTNFVDLIVPKLVEGNVT